MQNPKDHLPDYVDYVLQVALLTRFQCNSLLITYNGMMLVYLQEYRMHCI